MESVKVTVDRDLCISCGICRAVCPVNCIEYQKAENGLNVPVVDNSRCVQCGKCMQVCPGKGIDYKDLLQEQPQSFWFGAYKEIYSAWSLDDKRRKNAVSGGVVTELVFRLLEEGVYQSAFLLDTHQYQNRVLPVRRFTKEDSLEVSQKSRYLPVSQENAVAYMLQHREEKLIFVGTSCCVEGLIQVMQAYSLPRENYFIIGLFCDKTMTWNVMDYFDRYAIRKQSKMDTFYFRTKEVGGWPGGVQLTTESGETISLPNTARMKVKEYFQPERCLYCLNKLNFFADISLGDNYTGQASEKEGSNSVIVRTEEGERVWNQYGEAFHWEPSSEERVIASQHLQARKKNYVYSKIKESAIGAPIHVTEGLLPETKAGIKDRLQYKIRCFKLGVGAGYGGHPKALTVCLLWKNLKLKLKSMGKGNKV